MDGKGFNKSNKNEVRVLNSAVKIQKQKNSEILQDSKKLNRRKRIKENIPLLLMFSPIIVYYLIFRYGPMFGIVIAFQDFNLFDGYLKSPWVGLKYFKMIFTMPQTLDVIKNTFFLAILKVVVTFPFPILLALLLNEVRKMWFKRTIQTLVYLPHFLSWVIVGGMVVTIFSQETGVINSIISKVTGEPYPFLFKPVSWTMIFIGSGIWKEAGFSAIIYLSALSSIDPSLYEAASIDGANKFKQIMNITLPGIRSIIVLMMILSIGQITEVSFDQIYMLRNSAVDSISDVISTYVYRLGLQGAQYSLTAAMGLFQSILSLILVFSANSIAKKFDQSLW